MTPTVLDRPTVPRGVAETPPSRSVGSYLPPAAPSTARRRLPFIDGLRGVAILMVLGFHIWQCWGMTLPRPIPGCYREVVLLLRHGYLGVHLFLVLSGFCLTYPLAAHGAAGMRLDLRRFLQRRAWRILPPYYLALAAFSLHTYLETAIHSARGGPDRTVETGAAGQILAHFLMIHNLSPGWVRSINGSFWSLALEWQLYLLFPLLIWAFRRWGTARALSGVLAVTLAYRSWVYALHVGTGSWPYSATNELGFCLALAQVPGRLFEFAMGIVAALALAGRRDGFPPAWTRRYLVGSILCGLLAAGITLGWSSFSPVTDIVWGLAFFCLLMYAAGRSGAGGGWLDSRPLVAVGRISYSVYLINEPLIRCANRVVSPYHFSPVAAAVFFGLVVVPMAIGCGWLYFRLVESRFTNSRPRAA